MVIFVSHFLYKNEGLENIIFDHVHEHFPRLQLGHPTGTWIEVFIKIEIPSTPIFCYHITNSHVADISLSPREPHPILPATLHHFVSLNNISTPTTTLHFQTFISYLVYWMAKHFFSLHSFLNSFSIMPLEYFYRK